MRKEENSEKLLYSDSLLKVQLLSAADMTDWVLIYEKKSYI